MLHGRTTPWSTSARPGVRRRSSSKVSKRTVVYAELPGTQHAFDVFPSIRSAHIVRAIDRYLHWHWNTWRAGLDHAEEIVEAGGTAEN